MDSVTTKIRQILRLRQISMLVLVLPVAVAAFTSFTSGRSTAGDPKKAVASAENKLVGTWKQVKAKFGGKEHKIPEGTTQFKHITPTHFMFVDIDKDGNVFDSLGGPYTLKGAKYEETPEYGGGTTAHDLENYVIEKHLEVPLAPGITARSMPVSINSGSSLSRTGANVRLRPERAT